MLASLLDKTMYLPAGRFFKCASDRKIPYGSLQLDLSVASPDDEGTFYGSFPLRVGD